MRLWIATALLLLPCVAHAQDGEPGGDHAERREDDGKPARQKGGRRHFAANPSALVSAEIELKQASVKDGQAKALRKAAAPGAELFVPQRVPAEEWLKANDQPGFPPEWQPLEVWMSCDGSYGVVRGAWRQADATGQFMTLWQRQEDGSYKWLLSNGSTSPVSSDGSDMIAAHVADCSRIGSPDRTERSGQSTDKSIDWREGTGPDGTWSFTLNSWNGQTYPEVFSFAVPAAPTGG